MKNFLLFEKPQPDTIFQPYKDNMKYFNKKFPLIDLELMKNTEYRLVNSYRDEGVQVIIYFETSQNIEELYSKELLDCKKYIIERYLNLYMELNEFSLITLAENYSYEDILTKFIDFKIDSFINHFSPHGLDLIIQKVEPRGENTPSELRDKFEDDFYNIPSYEEILKTSLNNTKYDVKYLFPQVLM